MSETSPPRLPALRRMASKLWRARLRALPLDAFERDFRLVEPHTMLGVGRLRSLHAAVLETARAGLPGDLAECGVARGGSALLMALALLRAGRERSLWLFDTFEGLPEAQAEGNADVEEARRYTGQCRGEEDDVRELLRAHVPAQDVRTVRGLFADTVASSSVERLAVLHLDGDWYESIKPCLEGLWPRVVPGGIVQVDDYFAWQGCARAVDEFLSSRPELRLERIDASAVRLRKPARPDTPTS